MREDVRKLTEDYVGSLLEWGATPKGVYWPNADDLAKRFHVQLTEAGIANSTSERPLRLLDFGCGPGLLLDYLKANQLLERVDYTGVDIVASTVQLAQTRWPDQRFDLRDVREVPYEADAFDACIMCGVFTARPGNSYPEMVEFVRSTLAAVWPSVSNVLVFNTMAKHVDWEREDLFHWPLDEAMAACKALLSRHVRIRMDYGLWESTFVVRKTPTDESSTVPMRWSWKD
ncbi:hypothetical protein K32_08460 [Kaistia sp. 32K]|uniref:class I SAM-dependent methyltransferase n=1 Tax=Kaistia sp. 32K TaxID=2795690 RepID=UPI0019164FCD|nr:class I SAM-dependent methyltransferase [Kaistia sp. 32K]BCP52229.1 hypothetical protein K32_08460 [Kaistia sp. 32K]